MANMLAQSYSWRNVAPPAGGAPVAPSMAPEVMDANGFWGIDVSAVAPDGYSVTDVNGFEGVDPAAVSGNTSAVVDGWETFLV